MPCRYESNAYLRWDYANRAASAALFRFGAAVDTAGENSRIVDWSLLSRR